MVTAANLLRRVEALERGPGAQEKIFFIDGSDEALAASQWKAVRAWEQSHPLARIHVIVFHEVTAHYPDGEPAE